MGGGAVSLRFEVKFLSLASRLRLARERRRSLNHGWPVPGVGRIIRSPHLYEAPLFSQRFLGRPRPLRLIDVGANTGRWAERFLELIPADYVGFEPDPRPAAILRQRFPQGLVIQRAAGSRSGVIPLNLAADSVYSSVASYKQFSGHKADHGTAYTKVVTLDEAVPVSQCDHVVKIDVQGAEADVIRGASQVLSTAALLIVEAPLFPQTNLGNDLGTICQLLRPLGLAPVYFCRAGLEVSRYTIPVEHDVLFARSDEGLPTEQVVL